jgi:hypothetical protein
VFPFKLDAYDLEIETDGSLGHQVEVYADKVSDETDSLQIKDFIEQHWMMKGLTRISIQLDALCFTWRKGFRDWSHSLR